MSQFKESINYITTQVVCRYNKTRDMVEAESGKQVPRDGGAGARSLRKPGRPRARLALTRARSKRRPRLPACGAVRRRGGAPLRAAGLTAHARPPAWSQVELI